MTEKPSLAYVAQTVVDWPLQQEFLRFSGDRNPMHTDEVAARRTPPGQVVVYGMHMLLWALDSLAHTGFIDAGLSRIRVAFLKWIYLGDTVSLWFSKGDGTAPARCQIKVGELQAISIDLYSGDAAADLPQRHVSPPQARRTEPRDLPMDEVEGQQGVFPAADTGHGAALFPALALTLGPRLAAEIAACSYLVGMECPGLYSIDSQADLHLFPQLTEEEKAWPLLYTAEGVDTRFRRATLRVEGRVISGVLRAFVRNPPVQQASMPQVAGKVRPGEFHAMRALIVGGSRGLGEAAAKCIAAGGGRCTLTYAAGRHDAAEVARQIGDAGGTAAIARYDVREPAAAQLPGLGGPFTHMLYFATGPMFRPKSAIVSQAHMAEFTRYYLQGFHDLCVELVRDHLATMAADGPLVVYYPSSELLDERGAGLAEFVAAKASGEQLCRDLELSLPGLRVVTTRLPRLLTDQTTSLVPERLPNTVETICAILRQLGRDS